MQNFIISNVPYARKSPTATRISRFPFDVLEVGQRFFVPNTGGSKLSPIPVKAANALLAPKAFRVQRGVDDSGAVGRFVYRVDSAE